MEDAGLENGGAKVGAAGKTQKNVIGWIGFIVSIGVLLEQIYLHGVDLVTYYIPLLFNGRLAHFFTTLDPPLNILYKISGTLEIVNNLFFVVYSIVVLVLLFLRKKVVPRLLLIYVAIAGIVNILFMVFGAVQTPAVQAFVGYTGVSIEPILYLAADVLLFLYYLLSKRFRQLFTR
jgi:hypothetical protein